MLLPGQTQEEGNLAGGVNTLRGRAVKIHDQQGPSRLSSGDRRCRQGTEDLSYHTTVPRNGSALRPLAPGSIASFVSNPCK